MKSKKILCTALVASIVLGLFAGCGNNGGSNDNASNQSGDKIKLSIAGVKSEIQDEFEKMATQYAKDNGLSGFELQVTGDETIYSFMQKKYASGDAPVIAQLDPTDVYSFGSQYGVDLSNESWADVGGKQWGITIDDKLLTQPFCIEGRGIMYNKEAIEKVTGEEFDYKSIKSLDDFKKLLDKLVEGGMESPVAIAMEDWSLGAHYFTLTYESQDFTEDGATNYVKALADGTEDLKDNERFNSLMDTFDVLLDYNIYKDDHLSADYDVISSYFADGTIAFWFNGNWAWPNIAEYTDTSADMGIMPVPQNPSSDTKANTMICGGSSKQMMINNTASESEIQAAKDFLTWLAESDEGKSFIVEDANLISPFTNNTLENSDPLSKSVKSFADDGLMYPSWTKAPGDHYTVVGAAVQKYMTDEDRDALADATINYWKNSISKVK